MSGIFRCRAVSSLKNAVASDVIDVSAWSNADAADLGRQGIRKVVAVEVGRGDDVEVFRASQHLLQRDVGNGVFYKHFVAGLAATIVPTNCNIAELFADEVVTPAAKRPFGVLLDVALVHHGDALAVMRDGVLNSGANQTL